MPAEYAGFRGRAGARRSGHRRHPRKRAGPDRERLQGRIVRSRRPGRGRDAIRQSRDPPGQGADRRGRQGGRGRRALCALGRHQPGCDRYRTMLDPARRRSKRCWRISTAPWPALPSWHDTSPHRRRCPHLAAACAADAVRAEARGICRGLAPLAQALAAIARETLALQFGGAAGTLAALGDKGLAGRGTTGAGTQAAAAGRAMAHPSRPHRGSGLRVRHRRRHLRQDRPRRLR